MANRRTMGAVLLDESLRPSNLSSPLRRKSLAATPLSRTQKDLIQNDDESEILARRRQPQIANTSQSIDSERRVSLGLVGGLSSNEISEHYAKCIKLCAENKINAKNVFSLSMIDYMAVLNKQDQSSNNMQTAGTTLDVSTKIYGLRVDCVHTEVLKMAGDPGKQEKNPNELNENEDVQHEPQDPKPAKKRCTQNIISQNDGPETDVNLLILRPKTNDSDAQTTDLMRQIVFPVHATNCCLHLYEDVLLDFPMAIDDPTKEQEDVEVPSKEDSEDLVICPMFTDLGFIEWSEADIPDTPSPRENSPTNDNFRFDIDASFAEPCGNDATGLNYFDIRDGESIQNVERCGRTDRGEPAEQIVDFCESLAVQDQQKNSEYSYLKKSLNNLHWAGPVHWKPRSLTQKVLTQSKDVGACRQQSGRKKKEVNLVYNSEVEETISDAMKSKIQKKLQLKTVKQCWQENKLTLPEDKHYDNDNPTKFYYQCFRIMPLDDGTGHGANTEANGDTTVLDNEADYDYDNLNDTQDYCSRNNVPEECDGDNNDDCSGANSQDEIENQNPIEFQASQGFIGDNLVVAPKSTAQLNIPYSSKAKKIDMRQLKNGLWQCLTATNTKDSEENLEKVGEVQMKEARNLSDVYKKLPTVLKKDNTEALTLPLAFASLLHLCNDKNLALESAPDMSDLKIVQP